MKKFCLVFMVFIILSSSIGCGILFPDATILGDEYYQNIKAKNYRRVIELYSAEYFDKIPEEDALRLLEVVNSKLGNLISYSLESKEGKSVAGSRMPYSRYVLTYQVKYAKGSAKETLIVGKRGLQTKLEVWDYSIDSPDLILAD